MPPSTSTYNTNGKVETGRSRNPGYWCRLHCQSSVQTTGAAWGWGHASIPLGISMIPVLTWADYASGVQEIIGIGGGATYSDSNVEASKTWGTSAAWEVGKNNASDYPNLHAKSYRYLLTWNGYTDADGKYHQPYYLTAGHDAEWHNGMTDFPIFPIVGYVFVSGWTLDADIEALFRIPSVETVEIQQLLEDEVPHSWSFPTGSGDSGMGTTEAEFVDIANLPEDLTFVAGSVNGSDFTQNVSTWSDWTFDRYREIQISGGVSDTIGVWYPYDTSGGGSSSVGGLIGSVLTFFEGSIGTTETQAMLPRNYSAYGEASGGYRWDASATGGDTDASLKYTGNGCTSGTGEIKCVWSDLGIAYVFDGEVMFMGDTADVTPSPEFIDLSDAPDNLDFVTKGTTWSGETSPMIQYSGEWVLTMTKPNNAAMTGSSPDDVPEYVSPGRWEMKDPSPTQFQCKLTNPLDYNANVDNRVLLDYPRNALALQWTANNDIEVADFSGGEWHGHNCNVAVVGSTLEVTGVIAGAYIYRSGIHFTDDTPLHWTASRFNKLSVSCNLEASPYTASDFAGMLKIGGVFPDMTYRHCFKDGSDYRFDLCYSDGGSGLDDTQSYIDQANPFQTGGESGSLSWSWGASPYTTVTIGELTAGVKYVFSSLKGEHKNDTSITLDISREFNAKKFAGYTDLLDDDGPTQHYLERSAIMNMEGRYGFEATGIHRWISPHTLYEYRENFDLKEVFLDTYARKQPRDDNGNYEWTNVIGLFDSAWWDSDESRYTDERTLFAVDVCPMWFAEEAVSIGSIYARPIYDILKAGAWYGDGIAGPTDTRTHYMTIPFKKVLRGRVCGILYGEGGITPDESALTHYDVDFVDGSGTDSLSTDDTGFVRSLNLVNLANSAAFGYTFSIDNRKWTRIVGSFVPINGTMAIDSLDYLSRVYAAYEDTTGKLVVRIYEKDKPHYTSRPSTIAVDSAGIFVHPRSGSLIVAYDVSGTVYRRESTDEARTWGAAVSITSGSYPQARYSAVTGVELLTYIDGGNACCRRKLGTGGWGAEIVIASSASDSPAPITRIDDSKNGVWVVMVKASSGTISRYISNDDGQTWGAG